MTNSPTLKALRDRPISDGDAVTVSILVLSYNHIDYIEKCLEGCLDQICDFRVQIIVHDDASTDGTPEKLKSYAAQYPGLFHLILQEKNQYSLGVNPHFGTMLPAATGRYLAFCDGDDYWEDPTKLAKQVAVLDAAPEVAVTYGSVQAFNENGPIEGYRGGVTKDLSTDELKAGRPINTMTVVCRNIFSGRPTSLFVRTSTIGDLTLWAALGYYGSGRFMPDLAPAWYRVHGAGIISGQAPDRQIMMTALAHCHIAAFHLEQGDKAAVNRSTAEFISRYNDATGAGIDYATSPETSLRMHWRAFRRALKYRFQKR